MSIVIDASVAIKWIFSDEASTIADEILTSGEELLAPDLIYFEVGNVIWKRISRDLLDGSFGQDLLNEFLRIPLVIAETRSLAKRCWESM